MQVLQNFPRFVVSFLAFIKFIVMYLLVPLAHCGHECFMI